MRISRRDFLKYCTASAAALGLNSLGLRRLEAALASDGAPTLVWLHGAGCQGDSVSFLNLFADMAPVGPVTAGSVLTDHVNLAYHTVLMASAGPTAVSMARHAARQGGYVLVAEGAVPSAFEGHTCNIMTVDGRELTYKQALTDYAPGAAAVLCVGTCASFGGIPASSRNPSEPNGPTNATGVATTLAAASIPTPVINIPGCPTHPEWITWAVVQLILANPIPLDNYHRPTAIFGNKDVDDKLLNIHENCPRNGNTPRSPATATLEAVDRATTFGQDGKCLELLGCRGPFAYSDCPTRRWNRGENGPTNWCIDANAPCLGCVEPDFPGDSFCTDPQQP